ncbi:MAG: hypothetical protein GY913_02145 [Proteobacteria bacterium]|nr:hypothetical protein [Pseudomonadota bacterium]MCP4915700.1 hypothetical protein [Pseudomonadota bacterium]
MIFLSMALAAPPSDPAEIQPEDLVGTWRMELNVVTDAKVPVLGNSPVLSKRVNIATIELVDGELIQSHTSCSVTAVTERAIGVPKIPQSFTDALPDKSYPIELSVEDGKLRYAVDLKTEAVGYDASEPLPVPTLPEDPRVVDVDEDGHPGVTIQIYAPLFGDVDIYIVQYSRTTLSGVVKNVDRIAGGAEVEFLIQNLVGASNSLFVRKTELSPNNERSNFKLRRLPDGATCESL